MERRTSREKNDASKMSEMEFKKAHPDVHNSLKNTVRTHYVDSPYLRVGIMQAIKQIAPEIKDRKIEMADVVDNFKELSLRGCKLGHRPDGFLIHDDVKGLINNLKSILNFKDDGLVGVEKELLKEIIKSLEKDGN